MAVSPDIDAEVELLRQGKPQHAQPLAHRDFLVESVVGAVFVAFALALALGFDAEREWNAGYAVVLCLLFALAIRLNFDVGAGYTSPVMLVFVPMLLLLPTTWVPLLTAGSYLLGKLPDHLSGQAHPTRAIFVLGNSLFAIGPALVLVLADAQTPSADALPWYLAAIAAQVLCDVASGFFREWAGRGIAPRLQLSLFSWILLIDVLLWPLGVLAAFATDELDWAFLMVIPPAGLLVVFAGERARRIDSVMRLYETERGAVRSREALIAGASHEMLTHLSVVMGLSGHIQRLDDTRREQALATMDRELLHLRHLGRQFVDFTRLRSGRTPTARIRDTELRPVLERVAGAFLTRADIHLDVLPGLRAAADPDRFEQIVMALVDNAVRYAPGYPIAVRARAAGESVEVRVEDRGPGIDRVTFEALQQGENVSEGAGIGLFLCRALAEAQHGEIRAAARDGGGSVFTLVLPASK